MNAILSKWDTVDLNHRQVQAPFIGCSFPSSFNRTFNRHSLSDGKVFLQSFSIHIQMFFMPPDWLPESGLCLDWQGCGDWESLWHRRSLKETVQPPKQEVGSEVSTESSVVAPSAPPFGRSWARAEPVMVLSCEKDRQTPGCPITPSCWHVLGCLSGRNVRIGPANRDGLDSRYPEDWAWIKY